MIKDDVKCRCDCPVRGDIVKKMVNHYCLILRYFYFIFNDGMQKNIREIDDLILLLFFSIMHLFSAVHPG